jgi:hypothetical protein
MAHFITKLYFFNAHLSLNFLTCYLISINNFLTFIYIYNLCYFIKHTQQIYIL